MGAVTIVEQATMQKARPQLFARFVPIFQRRSPKRRAPASATRDMLVQQEGLVQHVKQENLRLRQERQSAWIACQESMVTQAR